MTTTIRDINELQDRRIMMEKKLPPFGYALILLTAALILFLVVWSTKNYRTYVSQSSGSVQAANKTYIMSSYSGSTKSKSFQKEERNTVMLPKQI